MVEASAGASVPVANGCPFGSPFGVALPRPVTNSSMTSLALAGWPQTVAGTALAQLGKPIAAAIEDGITRQAVLANKTAPLFRLGLDGSAIRNSPTSADAIFNWNVELAPSAFFTWTLTFPESGSSEGRTRLI